MILKAYRYIRAYWICRYCYLVYLNIQAYLRKRRISFKTAQNNSKTVYSTFARKYFVLHFFSLYLLAVFLTTIFILTSGPSPIRLLQLATSRWIRKNWKIDRKKIHESEAVWFSTINQYKFFTKYSNRSTIRPTININWCSRSSVWSIQVCSIGLFSSNL